MTARRFRISDFGFRIRGRWPRGFAPKSEIRNPKSEIGAAAHELTLREGLRLFRRFFPYLRPYRDKVVLGILLVFVGVPMGQIGFFLNKFLWDNVLLNYDRPTDERLSMFF